jgi:hypothetical protein
MCLPQGPRGSATVSSYFLRQKVTLYSYFLRHKVTRSRYFLRLKVIQLIVAKFDASCLKIPIQCGLNCIHDTVTSDEHIMMS